MKKVLFYLVGAAWMATGIMALGYMAAPEMLDAPQAASYIRAAAWGAMSFALLGTLCRMEVKNESSIYRR
jgi:hypothetical protein